MRRLRLCSLEYMSFTEYNMMLYFTKVHIISFALIMLNTDLHRASSEQARRKRKKMTKEEFIVNLRDADKVT